jgi:hypothetical protein
MSFPDQTQTTWNFPSDYVDDDNAVGDIDVIAPALQPRGRRMPTVDTIPPGYTLETVQGEDPYVKLYAREYWAISFGTLLSQDYGNVITGDIPLGAQDNSPEPLASLPGEDAWEEHYKRIVDYSQQLAHLPPAEAAELGADTDLLLTRRDSQFCTEFLGAMAVLGHKGAERLRLGTMQRSTNVEAAAAWLTSKLTPARWAHAKWSILHWSESKGTKELPADYKRFIGHVAAGDTHKQDVSSIRAYQLQKLNPDTWLYLCEDGKVRVKIDSGTLLPPSAAGGPYAPTVKLAVDHEPPKDEPAYHATQELVRINDGVRLRYKFRSYGYRVLAYPAKQRLVDVAGKALVARAQSV